ncbi:MAG: chromosome partitioning protein ParB [Novosphingobium sp. 17-62-19]|uniref:ParB/RepB/Spo0J family partition protein n=1 Tax=Novosphingobium sp. 17-62-19 TaxID=1970406 RepID=UPI000BC47422|nr:ParB/RepB/Spo0J family partition protein [Novosphingobium sp. 17-62-19]OZA18168.1 MAG: chromosome partitioning protein ParB [Novosphingobium sp. 17-62-19]
MISGIPLNKLAPSPRNVRKHSDACADAELKASIAAVGLLQNLVVRAAPKGRYTVEAGERRRQALQALAEDKVLPRDHPVACLVLDANDATAVESSLAENFQRLNMNPADEAQAFATLVSEGASAEDVARRFGLTVRFVEGRLRLANLAPVVFDALAAGEITLDTAKAFGATSDREIQARVFGQLSISHYALNAASIRRMVLSDTVRGNDPRARLVGREAYESAGGRVERELFDDEDSEAWLDVGLLEQLATARMEAEARALAEQHGLAWVRPTLDNYASHELTTGLTRLVSEPAPLSDEDVARLETLDAAYDVEAAILEDEESDDDAIAAAETEIDRIDQEARAIRDRPYVIAPDLRPQAGMILTLGRDGTPVLQPVFYGECVARPDDDDADGSVEAVTEKGGTGPRRSVLSKRLVDELAMQRRDVLSLHVASDPSLALDVLVFTLADAETTDWKNKSASTLRGGVPNGPIVGFEPIDAPASAGLAELRASLDESWRTGENPAARFDLFRSLDDEARAAWLGFLVGRTLEASLNLDGDRRIAFIDHLGGLVGIDMARWWRPTAANYFDRVSKQVILDALGDVGGPDLSSRFASVKKRDLAMSAERIFAGATITEVEIRDRALAWVPEVMRFGEYGPTEAAGNAADVPDGNRDSAIETSGADGLDPVPEARAA